MRRDPKALTLFAKGAGELKARAATISMCPPSTLAVHAANS